MLRIIGAFVVLLALWLLLSGIYKPMIIGFGVVSALIAVWVVARMDAQDGDAVTVPLKPVAFVGYLLWLMVEIAKANWAVTKIVMAPVMPVRQHLFGVRYTQKTDLAQVIFANSITLTPGTITVETEPDRFLVHALAYTHTTIGELGDMDARVSTAEGDV
ncbi:Na+/H+ antiporter subunit E [Alisedimentitalea sp. MJ-SS2]|uniref:Na+/H+ antiporter subunit E n=1 Tax=Aliisedimentitalea sp. MJ-SS2 TaxID=3049795 RepID=UPI0029149755|nr:Na+/H+ antiporter subunit E [Alisedimentitalea sp. MJ-SS2]MDU8928830.1 Na+/H+ antiporter subunit E [Alisedimentitalea sp. MJ-SS2]